MDSCATDMIWLIDDDIVNHALVRILLEKEVPRVKKKFFTGGVDALNELKNLPEQSPELPDIIILDLFMPGMNGWEFLDSFDKDFQQKCSNVVIYVISSSSLDEVELSKYPYARGNLSKPLKKREIQKMKKHLTEKKSLT